MSLQEQAIEQICRFAFFFSNMDTVFIDPSSQIKWEFGHNQLPEPLEAYFGNIHDQLNLHESQSNHDVLFHSSTSRINYISARIYDDEGNYQGSVVTGPYLLEEPTALMIQDVLFQNNLSISLKHIITQYYLSLPLISTYKAKTIAEFLAYSIAHIHSTHLRGTSIGNITYNFQAEYEVLPDTINNSTELSVELIEKRYRLQNDLLSAVEHGNIEKAEKLLHEDLSLIEKIPDRIPNDPLRSEKNLAFTFNTSLRIAAERGGLHPVYIHSMSEKFAIQIEKTSTVQQLSDLQTKMTHEYCEAVRKLSLTDFNYLIRKAIEFIRIHLDQDLSLATISEAIGSSSYELSRKFKKETGHTITEYINKLRINEALSIMENQNLSITDIAQMVGFNDVNYFTKVFKKMKGITPSTYRQGKKYKMKPVNIEKGD
ncbi:helix-turn-helix transcriptional regulator [Bacillus sp. V3B]|uniref:AraC family transcriptional regulator n=1 Tax=Bacillus sp. V3B TaxID=2804915 RepID=UPI00210EB87E|nr:AraC family transcriptional regulator [Bacillus sp. V3B]MCQ6275644.1 helix-turn-helix transcriptional regulator [Bacillus sp. V3B]